MSGCCVVDKKTTPFNLQGGHASTQRNVTKTVVLPFLVSNRYCKSSQMIDQEEHEQIPTEYVPSRRKTLRGSDRSLLVRMGRRVSSVFGMKPVTKRLNL